MELTLLTTARTTLCSVLVARAALNQWFCSLLNSPGTKALSEPPASEGQQAGGRQEVRREHRWPKLAKGYSTPYVILSHKSYGRKGELSLRMCLSSKATTMCTETLLNNDIAEHCLLIGNRYFFSFCFCEGFAFFLILFNSSLSPPTSFSFFIIFSPPVFLRKGSERKGVLVHSYWSHKEDSEIAVPSTCSVKYIQHSSMENI